ncbi:MAG: DUF4105 domain-containing protein, partial [Thermodesulfobacteriota bacterium]
LWRVRPLARQALVLGVGFAAVLAWWASLRPSNDRDWAPEVARPPTAEVDGDALIVRNVRNFDYRTEADFTERWEERRYDLAQLEGVDLFLSYWGSPLIAHTIVSFAFADGQHLAISIETRKERGEPYSAVRGFFRKYELYYVVADERDLIELRTNYRGEEVYLYRLRVRPEVARHLLLDYVATINEIAREPRWYNALVENCTTGIRVHVQHVRGAQPWDWRLLVNGRVDELLYERSAIDTGLPFGELKQRSDVVARARAAGGDPAFSTRIRDGLPDPPPADDG